MKNLSLLIFIFLIALTPAVSAWNGQLCSDVKYQKSIEAIIAENSTVYASCSYRMVANSTGGLIGIYYLGTTGAFTKNGTKLWEIDSGFVTKLSLWNDKLLIGSMGGLLEVDKNGSYISRYLTRYKLYDFDLKGNYAYLASGDVFTGSEMKGSVVKVYLPNMSKVWSVNLTQMPGRIRVGNGIVYVGTGYPSGYVGKLKFGELIGISKDGKILWKVNLGEWVRDLEVWENNAVVGTGYNSTGNLLVINPKGKVLLNMSMFYVEDILINGNIAYISGLKKVTAVDLRNGKKLWETNFPYRIKVLKLYKGKLLAGGGKFVEKNGTIYSVGDLYVINPRNGKIINRISTGYVRSLATGDDMIFVGTGSNILMALNEDNVIPKKVCGPGFLLLLLLLGKKIKKL